MLPATIATSVAPETISKVGRLFNGSVNDVLHELLQNARRAGASRITIATSGQPGDQLLHIVDDGSGIADPAMVVTLGRSGWSQETRDREDPAGMGVFSLAGRDVLIRSWSQPERRGWMAHIPADAWQSSRPIALSPDPINCGTAITVRMPPEWSGDLIASIRQVARYYPLPVTFDGQPVEQEGWLDGAIRVESWNGCRIGIFREDDARRSISVPRLNFHGVTIPCQIEGIGEVGRGHSWNARVDIVDCPALQLVLPARKEAVQNAALSDLRAVVRAAIFRTISAQDTHRLSFSDWCEARGIGVDMPEAAAYLHGWIAPQAAIGENYMSGTRVVDASMVIMPDIAAIIAQPAALAIARHSPFGGELVVEEPAFAGYRWYEVLARLETLGFEIVQDGRSFTVTETQGAPADADNGYVDSLDMVATLSHAGAFVDVRCEADIAFATDHDQSAYVDDIAIFIRRGAEPASRDVVDLVQRAAFDPASDSDADSYETQQERFTRDATDRIVGLLEGSDAAIEVRVRSLLAAYPWLVPADRTVTITMARDALDVAIAERTPEAA